MAPQIQSTAEREAGFLFSLLLILTRSLQQR